MEIPIWDGEWWRCIPFTIFDSEGIPSDFICFPTWIFGVAFIILIVVIIGTIQGGSGASSGGKSG